MNVQKSYIFQLGNAIFVQIITLEKINLLAILKIVQVDQVTSIILILKVG